MKFVKGFRPTKTATKKNEIEAAAPREISVLQQEYGQLINRAGELQYQISVYQTELNAVNGNLVSVNQEAAQRKQLDEAAKAAETTDDITQA